MRRLKPWRRTGSSGTARTWRPGRLVGRTGRQIAGWVALSKVSQRSCYAGVAEMSVYVATWARGQGVGDALMKAAIKASEAAGIWTLQGTVFPENQASLRLCAANGFREVGRRERIGKRNGNVARHRAGGEKEQGAGNRLRGRDQASALSACTLAACLRRASVSSSTRR